MMAGISISRQKLVEEMDGGDEESAVTLNKIPYDPNGLTHPHENGSSHCFIPTPLQSKQKRLLIGLILLIILSTCILSMILLRHSKPRNVPLDVTNMKTDLELEDQSHLGLSQHFSAAKETDTQINDENPHKINYGQVQTTESSSEDIEKLSSIEIVDYELPDFKILGQVIHHDGQTPGPVNILYFLSNFSKPQLEAKEACERIHGTLATPRSVRELTLIDQLLDEAGIPNTWLVWSAGYRNSTSWRWLSNYNIIQDEHLIFPATVNRFTTFLRPTEIDGVLMTGGLTIFRRDDDFGFIPRLSQETHHFVCQRP